MNIEIPPEKMQEALFSFLSKEIDEKKRDELIAGALRYLISRDTSFSPSHLQEAANAAAYKVVFSIMEKEFDKPETQGQIRELWAEAWSKLVNKTDFRDALVEKLSQTLVSSLFGNRY